MKYDVRFPSPSVEKNFQKALSHVSERKIRQAIMEAVEHLGFDPRPLGEPKIKPPLVVYSFIAQYRVRIGSYRVLYDVDDMTKTVWILTLRRRNEQTYG